MDCPTSCSGLMMTYMDRYKHKEALDAPQNLQSHIHIFFPVNASLRSLNVSCVFLSFLLITTGVKLFIGKSGLA